MDGPLVMVLGSSPIRVLISALHTMVLLEVALWRQLVLIQTLIGARVRNRVLVFIYQLGTRHGVVLV